MEEQQQPRRTAPSRSATDWITRMRERLFALAAIELVRSLEYNRRTIRSLTPLAAARIMGNACKNLTVRPPKGARAGGELHFIWVEAEEGNPYLTIIFAGTKPDGDITGQQEYRMTLSQFLGFGLAQADERVTAALRDIV